MISSRFLLLQGWRSHGAEMGKYVQVGAPEAGEWSGEHLIYKFTVLREGGKPQRLDEWLKAEWERLEKKGYVPEVHLTNCWVLGGSPVAFDIVIDLEPAPLQEQLKRVLTVLDFLRKYGIKAAAKVSSVRDSGVGFHVYADLSRLWKLGLEERWSDFYNGLAKYLVKVFNLPIDASFAHKHQYRAFASPREEKGDPSKLNCHNNSLSRRTIEELKELGELLGWDLALEALRVEVMEAREKVPATGVFDAKLFLDMFESLTSYKIKEEVRREAEARVLPFRKMLLHASAKHRWIERVLDRGLPDGRKRFIVWCAAPYLARRVREGVLSEEDALRVLKEFVVKAGGGKIAESQLRAWLRWALKTERRPMSLAKFIQRWPELNTSLSNLARGDQACATAAWACSGL